VSSVPPLPGTGERPRSVPIVTRRGLVIVGLVLGVPLLALIVWAILSALPSPRPVSGGRMTLGELRVLVNDLRPAPLEEAGHVARALRLLDEEPAMPALRDRCRAIWRTARFDDDCVQAVADRVAVRKRISVQEAWKVRVSDALAVLERE
jgi:hypothetical protein